MQRSLSSWNRSHSLGRAPCAALLCGITSGASVLPVGHIGPVLSVGHIGLVLPVGHISPVLFVGHISPVPTSWVPWAASCFESGARHWALLSVASGSGLLLEYPLYT